MSGSLTPEQLLQVEDLVNSQVEERLRAASVAGDPRLGRRVPRRMLAAVVVVLVVMGSIAAAAWWLLRPVHREPNPATLAAEAISAGVAAQSRGDVSLAVADYGRAVGAEPRNTMALYDLGVADYDLGRARLAAGEYRKVIAINAQYEPALFNLSIIDQHEANDAEALSLLQRAVRAAPGDPRAHFNLALMLRAMPKYRVDGDAQMKIALHLDPSLSDPTSKH